MHVKYTDMLEGILKCTALGIPCKKTCIFTVNHCRTLGNSCKAHAFHGALLLELVQLVID